MNTETKKRANPDYTESAVNLTNPVEVMDALGDLLTVQTKLTNLNDRILSFIPAEWAKEVDDLAAEIVERKERITALIDKNGSYQNVESGHYALKQRKVSKSYSAERFEVGYPQFAPAVIIKAVDETKLKGLIKGGLISEDGLRANEVLTEKESFVFIIK